MYRVGIENILGLKRIEDKGYEINPCVPDSWNEYELRIKNKTEDYIISVKRINRDKLEKAYNINKEKLYIKINNEIYSEKLIPRNAGHLDIEVFFSWYLLNKKITRKNHTILFHVYHMILLFIINIEILHESAQKNWNISKVRL